MDLASIAAERDGLFQIEESTDAPLLVSPLLGETEIVKADTPDFELTKHAAAGNISAFELLYERYHRRTYGLCLRMTSSQTEAEDLTQEVFVRIYKTLDQYDSKQGDLTNWLMRLARNLIIDDYRHRQRNPQNSFADDVEEHTFHLRAVGGTAQKEIERRELCAQVQEAIDKLPEDLRTCVILRDIEELSYQEIVDVLKIPEGTVKSRINRGRIELAKILRRMRVVNI